MNAIIRRVGKGAPAQTEPQSQSSRAPCPRVGNEPLARMEHSDIRESHRRRKIPDFAKSSIRVRTRSVATVGLVREESAQQEQDDRTSYEQSAARARLSRY